jgi:hypothetical protein
MLPGPIWNPRTSSLVKSTTSKAVLGIQALDVAEDRLAIILIASQISIERSDGCIGLMNSVGCPGFAVVVGIEWAHRPQNCPCDASEFICECHNGNIAVDTCCQRRHPSAERRGAFAYQEPGDRPRRMDEERSQIGIAPLGYAKQLLASARRMLIGHQSQPSGEVSPLFECGAIPDGSNYGSSCDGSDAWYAGQADRAFLRFRQ